LQRVVLWGLFIPGPKNELINEESLFLWLLVFKKFVKISNDDPAVIVDNHAGQICLHSVIIAKIIG